MKIVFVHLGPAKALHLKKNIHHLLSNFSSIEVVLITSKDGPASIKNIRGIEHFEYQSRPEVRELINSLEHNEKFRSGFWFFSLERIYALRDWCESNSVENFLHIESDILLMSDFPFEKISQLNKLAWTQHNLNADVATFLYAPNLDAITWLTEKISEIIRKDSRTTDMSALSKISHVYPAKVEILPSIPPDDFTKGIELERIKYFGGVFDPAAYGMWLSGQDPRNNLGIIRKYISLSESDVQPSLYKYKCSPLGTLQIRRGNMQTSLFNLHLHNKRVSLFGKKWKLWLALDVLYANYQIIKSIPSIRALWAILVDFQKRHGLISKKLPEIFLKRLRVRFDNRE